MPNITVPVGPSLWKLPASGAFTVPTPPAVASTTKALLRPNFTAGPDGWDPYRQLEPVVLENYAFFANGHDQPRYWDRAGNAYDLGSVAPTSFLVSDNGGGATFPAGTELKYALVHRNSTLGKETAPQYVTHVVGGSPDDVDVDWTDPLGEFDKTRIYRQLTGDSLYVLLSEEASSTQTYTDTDAIGTILTNTPYTRRYRTTLPPIFKRLVSHQNRLWGFTGEDSFLYYSQQASPALQGEFLIDDFPSGNFVEIAPWDGDQIVFVKQMYGRLYIFKRRAVYVLSGLDPLNFKVDLLFSDRGLIAPGAIAESHGLWYFLDEQGVYFTDLRGEPYMAGSSDGTQDSPLAPIWNRLNLDAADSFRLIHNEKKGLVEAHVALDHSPVPGCSIAFDARNGRFVSLDEDGIPAFAAGYLDDAAGTQRLCRVDEILHLFQDDAGNSDAVYAGDLTADTVSAVGLHQLMTTGSAFSVDSLDGGAGAPFQRYDSAGSVADSNRAYDVTADSVFPLLWSPTTPTTDDQLALGTIPFLIEFVRTDWKTAKKARVQTVVLQTLVESGGNLRVDTQCDQDAYVNQGEVALATSEGQHRVSLHDRAWRWGLRLVAPYAGVAVRLLAVDIDVEVWTDRA